MCLRHGKAEEGRPAVRFAQLLELSRIPVGQDDQVVPTDYFNGLVVAAVGRLPQPLSATDLAERSWDEDWRDGPTSGGNSFPWSHGHTIAWSISDRPTILPITHDPNLDKVMYLQMAFNQRPLRDGGGKPSLGRLAPWTRPLSKAAAMGAKICVLTSPRELVGGSHPFPEDLLEDIREILAPGAGRPADGQPFFLDILHSVALNIQDPDHQFSRDLEQGVPLGVTDPPLTSPGIWPLKKELKGEEPGFQQELPHPRAGITTPRRITSASSSGAHSWRMSPWAW